jgi:hypothetical protein
MLLLTGAIIILTFYCFFFCAASEIGHSALDAAHETKE